MISLETGEFTKEGIQVLVGDVLRGPSTNEVTVMIEERTGKIVVQDQEWPDIYHSLDEFLRQWSYVQVVRNLIVRR